MTFPTHVRIVKAIDKRDRATVGMDFGSGTQEDHQRFPVRRIKPAAKPIDWSAPPSKPYNTGHSIVDEFTSKDGKTRFSLQAHSSGEHGVMMRHSRVNNRQYRSYGKPCHSLESGGPIAAVRRDYERAKADVVTKAIDKGDVKAEEA